MDDGRFGDLSFSDGVIASNDVNYFGNFINLVTLLGLVLFYLKIIQ